jgi:hypothetical protein
VNVLQCTICRLAARPEIDAALSNGMSVRDVSKRWQVSKTAVSRHQNHEKNAERAAEQRVAMRLSDREYEPEPAPPAPVAAYPIPTVDELRPQVRETYHDYFTRMQQYGLSDQDCVRIWNAPGFAGQWLARRDVELRTRDVAPAQSPDKEITVPWEARYLELMSQGVPERLAMTRARKEHEEGLAPDPDFLTTAALRMPVFPETERA